MKGNVKGILATSPQSYLPPQEYRENLGLGKGKLVVNNPLSNPCCWYQ